MDWHFRVRQRMAEAESRGQHRSWYVDELVSSGAATVDSAHGSGAASAAANDPKKQYIPVPDDPALTNSICPVCQEKFEIKWLNEAQEFVWMDARKVGNRIYHASCYAEVTKDVSSGTVLGKRRAEGQEDVPLRTKVKTENVRL
jgi:pre-mRNA cleavage complex 2 protein Pcf11